MDTNKYSDSWFILLCIACNIYVLSPTCSVFLVLKVYFHVIFLPNRQMLPRPMHGHRLPMFNIYV